MSELYLTAYNGMILGPIAKALGWIMDKIYYFLSNVCGVENVAITIIVFTIFIYLCLFPLTYKQQKFSVLQRKMKPELDEIQKKYKGKKDQASMQAMQEETTALYDKYGVSMMGSCLWTKRLPLRKMMRWGGPVLPPGTMPENSALLSSS